MKEKIEETVLKELNEHMIDNAPISVLVIDKKGFITFTNKYFKKLTGNPNVFEGKNITKTPFFIRENLCPKYKELLTKGTSFNKEACLTKNFQGESKYINIIAVPIRNQGGEIESALSMALDVTDLVSIKNELNHLNIELEDKIKKKIQRLSKINDFLKQLLTSKMELFSNVSHDLKTPLAVIKLSLDLLEKEFKNKFPQLQIIDQEVNKISGFLTDFNLLTRTSEKNQKIIIEKIDLIKLINNLLKELKILAEIKKVTLVFKEKGGLVIEGNENKLEKMFSNIIINAIKYNKKNGWVKISLEKNPKNVIVSIADNGLGIAKKDLPHIFDRFYRSESARKIDKEGLGLGLAICRLIAKQHKGSIAVKTCAKGSVFSVELPINQ